MVITCARPHQIPRSNAAADTDSPLISERQFFAPRHQISSNATWIDPPPPSLPFSYRTLYFCTPPHLHLESASPCLLSFTTHRNPITIQSTISVKYFAGIRWQKKSGARGYCGSPCVYWRHAGFKWGWAGRTSSSSWPHVTSFYGAFRAVSHTFHSYSSWSKINHVHIYMDDGHPAP